MLVVEREVICDARDRGVDVASAEVLGADLLAGRGLHERRAAEEDRARSLDDDGLVAHRRDVRAAGRGAAHHERDLGDPGRRHPGLVVEDPAEVVAVGEDVGLEGEEGAAAVDEVDARQAVLEGDLLGPEVLLDGQRVVRPALDRRVVGDDDDARPLDAADPGDDPGRWGLVVVEAVGRERAQLEEWRPWIDEPVDPLPDRQLAALAMAGDRAVVAAGAAAGDRRPGAARSSATSAAIASWLARTSSLAGSSRLRRTGMARDDRSEPDAAKGRRRAVPKLRVWVTIALTTLAVSACGLQVAPSPTSGPSAIPSADPLGTPSPEQVSALVTIETRGGECPDGACGSVVAIEGDGRVHQLEPTEVAIGQVPPDLVEAILIEIDQANFPLI